VIDNLSYYLEEADFRVILEDIGADVYVQQKQGEQTWQLVDELRESDDLSKVRNCYIKRKDQFVFTGMEVEFSWHD